VPDLTVELGDERLELFRTVRSVSEDSGRGGPATADGRGLWAQLAALDLLGVGIEAATGGTAVDIGVIGLGLGAGNAEVPYAEAAATAIVLSSARTATAAATALRGHCDGSLRLIPVSGNAGQLRTIAGASFAQDISGPDAPTVTLVSYGQREGKAVLTVESDVTLGAPVSTAARAVYRTLEHDTKEHDAAELVAEGHEAQTLWDDIRSLNRLLCAAELAGGARWMLDTADAYSRVRHQFGHPIGSYQGLQHVLVDMLAAVEAAELLVFDALAAWGEEGDEVTFHDLCPVACAFVRRHLHAVMRDCYGVLGGIGFMEEHAVSTYNRTMLLRLSQLGSTIDLNESASNRIRSRQWVQ
jgi:alkylation response protein AidB-like acyl-CoA dehydrogenase